MFVQTELTPNPLTLKFIPGRVVMKEGTAFFQNKSDAEDSPFAKRFFNINGVNGVFLGSDFVTITKSEDLEWQILKPYLLGAIKEHYESGDEVILKASVDETVVDKNKRFFSSVYDLYKFERGIKTDVARMLCLIKYYDYDIKFLEDRFNWKGENDVEKSHVKE